MLPVKDQKRPGFINIQQYYIEEYLLDGVQKLPNVEIRWGHRVDEVTPKNDGVDLTVTADRGGVYTLRTEWLIACDGARSTVRDRLGLDFEGRVFEDNFLIADIRMKHEMPSERWFWFDPPFNPGRSALMHKQPDDVWRLDFQLGWNIDRAAAIRPENVEPFVTRDARRRTSSSSASGTASTPSSAAAWRASCTAARSSPATARTSSRPSAPAAATAASPTSTTSAGSSTSCCAGEAGERPDRDLQRGGDRHRRREHPELDPLDRFPDPEVGRQPGAARRGARARPRPRLRPALRELRPALDAGQLPGEPPLDARRRRLGRTASRPVRRSSTRRTGDGWLLDALGDEFVLLAHGWQGKVPAGVRLVEVDGLAADRLGLTDGAAALVRPDQYVAARWKSADAAVVEAALNRAKGGNAWLN